jgi:hypothetical protein
MCLRVTRLTGAPELSTLLPVHRVASYMAVCEVARCVPSGIAQGGEDVCQQHQGAQEQYDMCLRYHPGSTDVCCFALWHWRHSSNCRATRTRPCKEVTRPMFSVLQLGMIMATLYVALSVRRATQAPSRDGADQVRWCISLAVMICSLQFATVQLAAHNLRHAIAAHNLQHAIFSRHCRGLSLIQQCTCRHTQVRCCSRNEANQPALRFMMQVGNLKRNAAPGPTPDVHQQRDIDQNTEQ